LTAASRYAQQALVFARDGKTEETAIVYLLERIRQSHSAMMPFGHTLGPGEAVVVMPCEKRHHNVFGYEMAEFAQLLNLRRLLLRLGLAFL
jgi:hypothetical protein